MGLCELLLLTLYHNLFFSLGNFYVEVFGYLFLKRLKDTNRRKSDLFKAHLEASDTSRIPNTVLF